MLRLGVVKGKMSGRVGKLGPEVINHGGSSARQGAYPSDPGSRSWIKISQIRTLAAEQKADWRGLHLARMAHLDLIGGDAEAFESAVGIPP